MLRGSLTLTCVLTVAASAAVRPGSEREPRPEEPRATAAFRPLPFFYDLYTFRGDDRQTTVVAAFAVPAGRLEREREDGVRYRFDVTLVLADTALRSVFRTDDSVFVAVPRSLPGDHLLHTHIEVQAPPSSTTVQRVVMTDATTPGIGQLYGAPFPIPDYSGSQLMLSDIALGRPEAGGGWTRGDVTLALLPTSQLPASSFDVYYEIYNLPKEHRYSTEIAIERLDGSGSGKREEAGKVLTRFSGEAMPQADGSVRELRRVETSLPKGRYRLTVTVRNDNTGTTASRSRPFQVSGRGRGATMVMALPRG
ncbi:MAG: hypothetical protein AMXMBFR53_08140 [Gemmatimonadota bacterium]